MNEPDRNDLKTIAAGQAFEMDGFRPEDASGIVNLFRAVYGDGYPIKLYYDANALIEANGNGSCHSLVARTPRGDVVGVEQLYRAAPYESLYEAGTGLVLKEYRNQGITRQLLGFIANEWAPRQEQIEEIFGEPVCNHTHMQKLASRFHFVETALELALMPAEAYDRERSARGRVASLLAFKSYTPKPHVVHLPGAYEHQLRLIYSRLNYPREFAQADKDLPDTVRSKADMTIFDFARVARIAMHTTGSDLPAYIAGLEDEARAKNTLVLQMWIKLSDPWVGAAVEVLRKSDYCFGGVLPRWFDHDGLFMQKVLCDPHFEGIHLHSDGGREIGEMVLEDWKRTQPNEVHPHFA